MVPNRYATFFIYVGVMLSETWFIGSICGRVRVLHIIFGESMTVYSPRQLNFQFYKPMLVLLVCASFGIATAVLHGVYVLSVYVYVYVCVCMCVCVCSPKQLNFQFYKPMLVLLVCATAPFSILLCGGGVFV